VIYEQFPAVETFVDAYLTLIELADDIHRLGQTGIRGLIETFETLDAIRATDLDSLVDVPYVDEENATALQTVLEETNNVDRSHPTPLEQELRTVDGPLILDSQRGLISGELVPSDSSNPKYRSDVFGAAESDDRELR